VIGVGILVAVVAMLSFVLGAGCVLARVDDTDDE
jgi:hypothetical protein